jgi:hypothetical protein
MNTQDEYDIPEELRAKVMDAFDQTIAAKNALQDHEEVKKLFAAFTQRRHTFIDVVEDVKKQLGVPLNEAWDIADDGSKFIRVDGPPPFPVPAE